MNFEIYLTKHLTADQFNTLNTLLGISPHRLTKIFRKPEIMEMVEMEKIVKLIDKKGLDVPYLIHNFNCGCDRLSYTNAKDLLQLKLF